LFENDLTHRPKREIFLPAAVEGGDVWFGLAGVEEQLVVVATALAAGVVGAQGEASVAAQLHAGVVPAEVAGGGVRGAAGAGGEGQGEGEQGEGLGLGHESQVRCRIWRNARWPQGWQAARDVTF